MQTRQGYFLELLGEEHVQYIIPVYQRLYSWTEKQCETLWTDIMRAATYDRRHFLSTLLYIPEDEEENGCEIRNIIDGQQRTATVTLLLAALARYMDEHQLEVHDFDAGIIMRRYLHSDGSLDGKLKLVLSRSDANTLAAIVNGEALPEEASANVVQNFEFFMAKMKEDGFDVEKLCKGLELLTVIFAELTNDDSPQLVFESLNSKGMPLTMGDLVRNSLLVGVGHKEQARLYHEYWEQIEAAIGDDPDGTKLNAAVHGWLAIRFPRARIHDAGEVYDVFKSYIIDVYDGSLEDLLEELRGFCEMFGETIRNNPDKKFTVADWAKGKARTRAGSFDDLHGPESSPLKRDLGASRRTFT